jgi:hypothetical protein
MNPESFFGPCNYVKYNWRRHEEFRRPTTTKLFHDATPDSVSRLLHSQVKLYLDLPASLLALLYLILYTLEFGNQTFRGAVDGMIHCCDTFKAGRLVAWSEEYITGV